MMNQLRFCDGTPVSQQYLDSVSSMISGALSAMDHFSEDELEAYSERERIIERNLRGLSKHQINALIDLKESLSASEQYLWANQFFVDSSGSLVGLIVSSHSKPFEEPYFTVKWASRLDDTEPFVEQVVQASRIGRRIGAWYQI